MEHVPRYIQGNIVGKGSYGIVVDALDTVTQAKVAIKHMEIPQNPLDGLRILRELKLLRLLRHADIVRVRDVLLPSYDLAALHSVDIVFEHVDTDLHKVMHVNKIPLTSAQHTVILYQMLRGLDYMHKCGVLHRDIKPSNILINNTCKVKIADLGLSRPKSVGAEMQWSDYVATRWYRAPEVCGCFYGHYSESIDVWAMGCIYAELILGQPLFPGRNVTDQLCHIVGLLGNPEPATLAKVRNHKAREFLETMPRRKPVPFERVFPNANPTELDMLRRLLSFDPEQRPTCEEALRHELFRGLPHAENGKVAQELIDTIARECDLDVNACTTQVRMRELLYNEILFHKVLNEDAGLICV